MIKKIIGIIASLAILALIVMTALGAGTYSSMLHEDLFTAVDEQGVEHANSEGANVELDSLKQSHR